MRYAHDVLSLPRDEEFPLQVVGESNYQDALEAAAGGRTDYSADVVVGAVLVLEDTNPHDAQAVRVDVRGRTVGYLPRQRAREFRELLESASCKDRELACHGRIRGGWDRGDGDRGEFGITLDLLLPQRTRAQKAAADDDGQVNPYLNFRKRVDRQINEMLGFVRGVVTDRVVLEAEVHGFRAWLRRNPDVCVSFPGKELAERIERIFADGRVDEDEREELRWVFEKLTGEQFEHEMGLTERFSSASPLTEPPPDPLLFAGQCYVVTGRFLCGSRRSVISDLEHRGASIEDGVTKRTDVLLVGSVASRDWKRGAYGTKVERAVELRGRGTRPAIVAEDHWVAQLGPR